jgi:TetR/AcrR family transcriptional repressor of mexJK operon
MTSKKAVEVAEPGYAPRERGLKRRDQFLDVATEIFVRNGFEAASLQEIVNRAGGSLATLYRMFGNKEGLYRAVIERKGSAVSATFDMPDLAGREPREVLCGLGERLLELILSDDAIGLHRLMITEAGRNPQLREIFMERAPNRVAGALADYFTVQTKAGRIKVADPKLAAVQFLEMIKGDYYMRGLLGEQLALSAKERKRVVARAVDIFLNGVLPR